MKLNAMKIVAVLFLVTASQLPIMGMWKETVMLSDASWCHNIAHGLCRDVPSGWLQKSRVELLHLRAEQLLSTYTAYIEHTRNNGNSSKDKAICAQLGHYLHSLAIELIRTEKAGQFSPIKPPKPSDEQQINKPTKKETAPCGITRTLTTQEFTQSLQTATTRQNIREKIELTPIVTTKTSSWDATKGYEDEDDEFPWGCCF